MTRAQKAAITGGSIKTFNVLLRKQIVVTVEAEDETEACERIANDGDLAPAWDKADAEIVSVSRAESV